MTPRLLVLVLSATALATSGCGDDAHKGTISHGSATSHSSASPPASAPPPAPRAELRLDPGTPLMTAPVAKRLRKRLSPLGVSPTQVRITGALVEAEVAADKRKAARQKLSGGRLDILLIDTSRDRLAGADDDAAAKRFGHESEQVEGPKGTRTAHFLRAKPSERDALRQYLQTKVGPLGVLGPLFDGSPQPSAYRSYVTQDGRIVRGEHILSVSGAEQDGKAVVRVTFTPPATAGLRWHIKHGSRFLLYADREALSAITPKALDQGESLSFPLASRGDLPTTRAAADALAKRMNGTSLSHRTKLLPARP